MSILQVVPGLRIAAPARRRPGCAQQLREAVDVDDAPTVVRFPKGAGRPAAVPAVGRLGGMDVLRAPQRRRPDVLLVAVGAWPRCAWRSPTCSTRRASRATVVDPRWVKPVDEALVPLAARHRLVVTVEDNGRVGGVGSAVAQALRDAGVRRAAARLRHPAAVPRPRLPGRGARPHRAHRSGGLPPGRRGHRAPGRPAGAGEVRELTGRGTSPGVAPGPGETESRPVGLSSGQTGRAGPPPSRGRDHLSEHDDQAGLAPHRPRPGAVVPAGCPAVAARSGPAGLAGPAVRRRLARPLAGVGAPAHTSASAACRGAPVPPGAPLVPPWPPPGVPGWSGAAPPPGPRRGCHPGRRAGRRPVRRAGGRAGDPGQDRRRPGRPGPPLHRRRVRSGRRRAARPPRCRGPSWPE